MGRWFNLLARLAMAGAVAAAIVVMPATGAGTSVVRAAACPPPPATIAKVVNRDLRSPLTCFGSGLLTFRAFVQQPEGVGGTNPFEIAPQWLDDWAGSWVLLGTSQRSASTVAFIPPALGHCNGPKGATCPFAAYAGRWVTVSAHYDGPVAQTCRFASHAPGKGYTKQAAVNECREKLIILSVGPDTLPATDTLVSSKPEPAGPSTAPLWAGTFAFVGMLVLGRSRKWR